MGLLNVSGIRVASKLKEFGSIEGAIKATVILQGFCLYSLIEDPARYWVWGIIMVIRCRLLLKAPEPADMWGKGTQVALGPAVSVNMVGIRWRPQRRKYPEDPGIWQVWGWDFLPASVKMNLEWDYMASKGWWKWGPRARRGEYFPVPGHFLGCWSRWYSYVDETGFFQKSNRNFVFRVDPLGIHNHGCVSNEQNIISLATPRNYTLFYQLASELYYLLSPWLNAVSKLQSTFIV